MAWQYGLGRWRGGGVCISTGVVAAWSPNGAHMACRKTFPSGRVNYFIIGQTHPTPLHKCVEFSFPLNLLCPRQLNPLF